MRTTGIVLGTAALLLLPLIAGCSKKPEKSAPDFPDPRGWFIESYDKGVITVQHESYTSKAACIRSEFPKFTKTEYPVCVIERWS